MSAFPKTRAAAGYAASHGPSDLARTHAGVLLRWLDTWEGAIAEGGGRPPATAHGVLRGMVLAARDLVGPAWLAVRSDDPDIAAFTAMETTPRPPAPAELDEIISRVLWARFGPQPSRSQGTESRGEDAPPGDAPVSNRVR